MDTQTKITMAKENIWQAIKDYGVHTDQTEVLDDITATFVGNLAEDNIYAKRELRELFRTSPAWNEELDAIIINGTRTHNPDYLRVESFQTAHGSFSDISSIAPALKIAAVNLSCGYYNAHTPHEFINHKHLNATVRKVIGMVSDAEKTDFPKYEYLKAQRDYYSCADYWDDPYGEWFGYGAGVPVTKIPEDLPPEYKELYEELLDLYAPEELEYFRLEYGDKILRELYEQEYCVNAGRR